jgi:hypothetical protein
MAEMKRYRVVIEFKSPTGLYPDVRVLCGDTIFLALRDGETATYRTHHVRGKRKTRRAKS